jgi:hypothetical protein
MQLEVNWSGRCRVTGERGVKQTRPARLLRGHTSLCNNTVARGRKPLASLLLLRILRYQAIPI